MKMNFPTTNRSEGDKPQPSRLSQYLKIAITLLILFFLGRYIQQNIDNIYDLAQKFNYIYFIIGSALILSYMTLNALLWNLLLIRFNIRSSIPEVLWTFFLAMFGKYVPGKIWVAAIRVSHFKESDNSKKKILGSIALEHIYILCTGLFFFLATWSTNRGQIARIVKGPFIIIAVVMSIIIVLRPQLIIGLFNVILKAIDREPVEITVNIKDSLQFFFLYLVTWAYSSLGIWLVVYSVIPTSPALILKIGSAFAASYIIGFIALIAPGGLGVREGIFAVLLSTFFPAYISVLLAFAVRIAFTGAEIAGVIAAYIYRHRSHKLKHSGTTAPT